MHSAVSDSRRHHQQSCLVDWKTYSEVGWSATCFPRCDHRVYTNTRVCASESLEWPKFMASLPSVSTCVKCGGLGSRRVLCPSCSITISLCKSCWSDTIRCATVGCGAYLTTYEAPYDPDAVLTLASSCSAVPDSLENAHVDWAGTPTPRRYQVQAANAAFQENKIINLPTGTGKTLIAVMLIDWFRRQIPERSALFLVESIALVRQQACVVRNVTTFRDMLVSEITGEEAEWTSEWWNDAKTHPHVLVCTAEVARKAMTDHAFLRPSDLSLVVFDEAHKAVGHHPYVEVARRIVSETTSVRMVGFTASYLHGRLSDPEGKLQKLQSNLHAEIWLPSKDDIQPFLPKQRFERIHFSETYLDSATAQVNTETIIAQVLSNESVLALVEIQKPLQDLSRKAGHIFQLLGRHGWLAFMTDALCPMVRAKLEVKQKVFGDRSTKISDAIAGLDKVRSLLIAFLRVLDETDMQDMSEKGAVLMTLLKKQSAEKPDFRCLVFTEMVALHVCVGWTHQTFSPRDEPSPCKWRAFHARQDSHGCHLRRFTARF